MGAGNWTSQRGLFFAIQVDGGRREGVYILSSKGNPIRRYHNDEWDDGDDCIRILGEDWDDSEDRFDEGDDEWDERWRRWEADEDERDDGEDHFDEGDDEWPW